MTSLISSPKSELINPLNHEVIRLKDGFRDKQLILFKECLRGELAKTKEEKQERNSRIAEANKLCALTAQYNKCNDIIIDLFNECKGLYLAGGAARTIALGRGDIHDYDLFFCDQISVNRTHEFLLSEGFVNTFECPKGSLRNMEKDGVKLQLITPRFYSNVADLIDSFDFTATQFAITSASPLLVYSRLLSVVDVNEERLRINLLEYPVATLKRVRKYMSYGFDPTPTLFDDISSAIDELFRRVKEEPESIVDVRSMSRLYID